MLRDGKHGAIAVNGALYEYTDTGLSGFHGEIAVSLPSLIRTGPIINFISHTSDAAGTS